MVCLGFEPGAAGWKAQTNPLSYGGTTQRSLLLYYILSFYFPPFDQMFRQTRDTFLLLSPFFIRIAKCIPVDSQKVPLPLTLLML